MYTKSHLKAGPPHSAASDVYDYLQDEILSGRLPGGSSIRQEEIAHRLSLSRIPVRDALRHLAAEGFVSIESNRRIVVTLLRKDDLRELYEMRAVLEGLAARHAAHRLTESDFSHLAWLAESMDRSGAVGDQWLPVHDQFHDVICGASDMPRLIQETRRLRKSLQPQVRLLILQSGEAELPSSHHRSLVKAMRTRDPDHVERAVKEHIREAATEIISAIEASKEVRKPEADKRHATKPNATRRRNETRERGKKRAIPRLIHAR